MTLPSLAILLAASSLVGFFLDWLFAAEVREADRNRLRRRFRRLYEIVERTDFSKLQVWVAGTALRLLNGTSDHTIRPRYFIINALAVSTILTTLLSSCGVYLANRRFFYIGSSTDRLLMLRFGDTSVDYFFFTLAAYVGNFLFDLATLLVSFYCLRFVVRKKRFVLAAALVDSLSSYLFVCAVVASASIASKLSFVPSDFYLKDYLAHPLLVLGAQRSYAGIVVLCGAATTFIPVALYGSSLILLSMLKMLQWIFATTLARFSEDTNKTFFGWLATGGSTLSLFAVFIAKMLG